MKVSTRKKITEKSYKIYRDNKHPHVCDFCDFTVNSKQVEREYEYFWLVRNMFSYDLWDNLDVLDHLMIVPKKHVESIGLLPAEALVEYSKIIAEFEQRDYSFYARSMKNVCKTVPHQHTHLLKLGKKHKKVSVYIKKPYIFWYK